jgi:hypothetical protein
VTSAGLLLEGLFRLGCCRWALGVLGGTPITVIPFITSWCCCHDLMDSNHGCCGFGLVYEA